MPNPLTTAECLRYGRQILLPQIGEPGQMALKQATVAIVGVGGLGSVASMYLASAGVGTLVLADFDNVSRSNLQRQILFQQQHIGENKAQQGAQNLRAMAPNVNYRVITDKITGDNVHSALGDADVVLDCSDNIHTRLLVNQACIKLTMALVSGAAAGFDGQLLTLLMTPDSACYHCLYPQPATDTGSCLQTGVIGPLVGIIGSMQALQAIKIITAQPRVQAAQLLRFNGSTLQWQRLDIAADPACPSCGSPNAHNRKRECSHAD